MTTKKSRDLLRSRKLRAVAFFIESNHLMLGLPLVLLLQLALLAFLVIHVFS